MPRKKPKLDVYSDRIGVDGESMTIGEWDKAMSKLSPSDKRRLFDQLQKEVAPSPGLAGFSRR
ncbi:MAG: hypothetical protein Q7K65_03010 [Candidatus Buchananbacteria bacterium]|nr:hypothetical protein [Candidatus Buchananbacteria bacterium]